MSQCTCMYPHVRDWPLHDETRSTSAIQFPPPTPTPTMVPNMRGLVIVDTRSGLIFEKLVNKNVKMVKEF